MGCQGRTMSPSSGAHRRPPLGIWLISRPWARWFPTGKAVAPATRFRARSRLRWRGPSGDHAGADPGTARTPQQQLPELNPAQAGCYPSSAPYRSSTTILPALTTSCTLPRFERSAIGSPSKMTVSASFPDSSVPQPDGWERRSAIRLAFCGCPVRDSPQTAHFLAATTLAISTLS